MGLLNRALQFLRPNRLDSELQDEMRFHLELREQENLAAGMTPAQAHEDAVKTFGNFSQKQEDSRDRKSVV